MARPEKLMGNNPRIFIDDGLGGWQPIGAAQFRVLKVRGVRCPPRIGLPEQSGWAELTAFG